MREESCSLISQKIIKICNRVVINKHPHHLNKTSIRPLLSHVAGRWQSHLAYCELTIYRSTAYRRVLCFRNLTLQELVRIFAGSILRGAHHRIGNVGGFSTQSLAPFVPQATVIQPPVTLTSMQNQTQEKPCIHCCTCKLRTHYLQSFGSDRLLLTHHTPTSTS
jgi:hypothetical protein